MHGKLEKWKKKSVSREHWETEPMQRPVRSGKWKVEKVRRLDGER
jgi:hypothetical protein